jgi:hypothetical protein
VRRADIRLSQSGAPNASPYIVLACRTKNGVSTNSEDVKNYSLKKSPLIYLDSNRYRYVQPYDPIWITTNTAHGTVRSGQSILAGIAIIKSIDHAKSFYKGAAFRASPQDWRIVTLSRIAGQGLRRTKNANRQCLRETNIAL